MERLSATVFGRELKKLEIAFNRSRPYPDDFKALLFEDLKAELSDTMFQTACALVRRQDRALPPAEGFIRKVKGEMDPAKILWAQIIHAIDSGVPVHVPPEGMFALNSIGGFANLKKGEVGNRRSQRYEFENYYRCAGAVQGLPQPRVFNAPALEPEANTEIDPPISDTEIDPPISERQAGIEAARRIIQTNKAAAKSDGMESLQDMFTMVSTARAGQSTQAESGQVSHA